MPRLIRKIPRYSKHRASGQAVVTLSGQIETLWRFRIPAALRQNCGYPELTENAKRKILGLNLSKLYGIQAVDSGSGRRLKCTHCFESGSVARLSVAMI